MVEAGQVWGKTLLSQLAFCGVSVAGDVCARGLPFHPLLSHSALTCYNLLPWTLEG